MTVDITPYSTALPMMGALPAWVPLLEQQRIQAYAVYESLYWNNENTYRIVARDSDISPIYVPTAKIIVETMNRYVGTGFDFMVDPLAGPDEQKALAFRAFTSLFRREKFKSKYAMNKRYGLIRGDWLWHIIADPLKPPGKRISIRAIDPASWFPIYDDDDLDKLIRVHIAEVIVDEKGKEYVKRLTYDRADNGGIIWSEAIFDIKDWQLSTTPSRVLTPPTALPPQITAFPVYSIKNFEEPGNPYGSSELRGVERIITAVSQAMSDEDIALALEGLGMYATDGPGPVDEEGNDIPWEIGPARVAENAKGLRRITGVGSLQPYGDHLNRLTGFLHEASGTTDAVRGKVDVTVAESGIALLLQMAPALARASEKDQEILDVHTQMFFDLKNWFLVYEGLNFLDADIVPILGEKLPVNKDKAIASILNMVDSGVMSKQTAREQLAPLGFQFATDEQARVNSEAAADAEVSAANDPVKARMEAELLTLGGANNEDEPTGNVSSE